MGELICGATSGLVIPGALRKLQEWASNKHSSRVPASRFLTRLPFLFSPQLLLVTGFYHSSRNPKRKGSTL